MGFLQEIGFKKGHIGFAPEGGGSESVSITQISSSITASGGTQVIGAICLVSVVLDSPSDNETVTSNTPTFTFTGTDVLGNPIEYEIQIDTVNTFDSQSGNPLVDSISDTNLEFTNSITPSDTHPFNSGEAINFMAY